MLKKVRLHNFRTFLNSEIELTQRHLLIGKNNTGKTNLCLALRFLGATARMSLAEAAATCVHGGIAELKNWSFVSNQIDLGCRCELLFQQKPLVYDYDVRLEVAEPSRGGPSADLMLRVVHERLTAAGDGFTEARLLESDGHEVVLLDETQAPDSSARMKNLAPTDATALSGLYRLRSNPRAVLFRGFLANWLYFRLCPDSIRSGWREAERTGAYYADGKHVAGAIFRLKNENEPAYRRLLERVREFDEALDAINFLVAPDQGIVPFVAMAERVRASWASLSDGTLCALAHSHLIEESDSRSREAGTPPPLAIIEEPETGIYAGMLRRLLEAFEDSAPLAQFIFTTHSPYFIDLFDHDPASVTFLRRDRERTVIERLKPDQMAAPVDERVTLAERFFAEMLG